MSGFQSSSPGERQKMVGKWPVGAGGAAVCRVRVRALRSNWSVASSRTALELTRYPTSSAPLNCEVSVAFVELTGQVAAIAPTISANVLRVFFNVLSRDVLGTRSSVRFALTSAYTETNCAIFVKKLDEGACRVLLLTGRLNCEVR